jgi:hypothetical protein
MSIQSFTSAPLDFRLRGRWVAATVDEVKAALAGSPFAGEDLDETLRPAIEALLETTAHFDRSWGRLMDVLDRTGVPGHFLDPLVSTAQAILDNGDELLSLLRENTRGYRDELERTADTLGRIGRERAALAKAQASPGPDYARIDRGLKEAERGEGEDSGTVMARFLTTGEL